MAIGGTAIVAAALFTLYEFGRGAAEAQALAQLLPNRDLTALGSNAWAHGLVAFALAALVATLAFRRRIIEDDDRGVAAEFEREGLDIPGSGLDELSADFG